MRAFLNVNIPVSAPARPCLSQMCSSPTSSVLKHFNCNHCLQLTYFSGLIVITDFQSFFKDLLTDGTHIPELMMCMSRYPVKLSYVVAMANSQANYAVAYRRRARMIAWYTQPHNFNPFKKYRIQQRKVTHVEDGAMQANQTRDAGEQSGFPTAVGILMASSTDGQASGGHEPSQVGAGQATPANPSTSVQEADKEETAPNSLDRDGAEKRTGNSGELSEERNPQFTFVGQLRAALFNSWINLMLVAIPAGRKPSFPYLFTSFPLFSDQRMT